MYWIALGVLSLGLILFSFNIKNIKKIGKKLPALKFLSPYGERLVTSNLLGKKVLLFKYGPSW